MVKGHAVTGSDVDPDRKRKSLVLWSRIHSGVGRCDEDDEGLNVHEKSEDPENELSSVAL